MTVGGIMLFLVVAAAFAAATLLKSESQHIKRALGTTPRRTIEAFAEGEPGKIVGTLSYLGEPLCSPLTGRTCAYYEIHVEEYSSRGSNTAGGWQTVIHEADCQDFMIDDGTGRAIVSPSGARFAITIDSHTKSGSFDDPTVREKAFLESHGRKGQGWVFNKVLRYREGILEAGESVAILGRGTKEPDPDGVNQVAGYRSGPPMRLRLGGSHKLPLMISDDIETLG